jgi:hypothetical protein
LTICTAVTKSHLAFARTLALSIRQVNPDARVYVLLADALDSYFDPAAEPFQMVLLRDLSSPDVIQQMSFYYTPFEFCCAVRPFLHDYMWHHTDAAEWLLLDGDIYALSDMGDVFEWLRRGSVLLNPHNSSPARREFFAYTEFPQLFGGIFNGGFLGVRRCDSSRRFIDWFMRRVRRFGFDGYGMYVDQLWLNHVPQFFPQVVVYSHPGANLAFWNLYQRTLAKDQHGRWQADGQPLMFMHFSGWDFDRPAEVSKHATIYQTLNIPQLEPWKELALRYRDALAANGHEQCRRWPCAFTAFDDGTPITLAMRRHFYRQLRTGQVPAGGASPFSRPADFEPLRDGSSPTIDNPLLD